MDRLGPDLDAAATAPGTARGTGASQGSSRSSERAEVSGPAWLSVQGPVDADNMYWEVTSFPRMRSPNSINFIMDD